MIGAGIGFAFLHGNAKHLMTKPKNACNSKSAQMGGWPHPIHLRENCVSSTFHPWISGKQFQQRTKLASLHCHHLPLHRSQFVCSLFQIKENENEFVTPIFWIFSNFHRRHQPVTVSLWHATQIVLVAMPFSAMSQHPKQSFCVFDSHGFASHNCHLHFSDQTLPHKQKCSCPILSLSLCCCWNGKNPSCWRKQPVTVSPQCGANAAERYV